MLALIAILLSVTLQSQNNAAFMTKDDLSRRGYDVSEASLMKALNDSIEKRDRFLFFTVLQYSDFGDVAFMTKDQTYAFLRNNDALDEEQREYIYHYLARHFLDQLTPDEADSIFRHQYSYAFSSVPPRNDIIQAMKTLSYFAEHCGFSISPFCKKFLLEGVQLGHTFPAFYMLVSDKAEPDYDYVYYICEVYEEDPDFRFHKDFFLLKKAELEKAGKAIATKDSIIESANREIQQSMKMVRMCFESKPKNAD